jgi:hypothetical protein
MPTTISWPIGPMISTRVWRRVGPPEPVDPRHVVADDPDDLDERQLASWMKQATANPGFGAKKR